MKLTRILIGEILESNRGFEIEIDKLKEKGATYIGSGDYG